MFNPKKLEQVAKQIHDSMPQPVKELGSDVEQKVRQVIQEIGRASCRERVLRLV